MKTKRVNDEFHRLDVKLPTDIYGKISDIAVNNFDARVHHISRKPEISSTLIYLLQLGIQSFTEGKEVNKCDTDINTDTILITIEQVKEMIDDAIANHVLESHALVKTINNTDINTDKEVLIIDIEPKIINDNGRDLTDLKPIKNTNELTDNENEVVGIVNNHISDRNIKDDNYVSLSESERELINKIKVIPRGTVFESQAKLCDFVGLEKSQRGKLSKLKKHWENLFTIKAKGNALILTKI